MANLPFFILMSESLNRQFFGTAGDAIVVYILSSMALGITIDLVRHRIEGLFIRWANLSWLKCWLALIASKLTGRQMRALTLRAVYQECQKQEREIVQLWLELALDKHERVREAISRNDLLQEECARPAVSISTELAILSVFEGDSLRFMIEEYFLYYEFSFNAMLACVLMAGVTLGFHASGRLSSFHFWLMTALSLGLIVVFHELTVFWLLATKTFARKLLLVALLK